MGNNSSSEPSGTEKHQRKGKNGKKKGNSPSPTSVSSPVNGSNDSATSSPVRPEVVYQEKSPVQISPVETQINLGRAIKDPADYASKDNSVDGILSIKH